MAQTVADPFVKLAEEAEWTPPRGGFQSKPNEFEAVVQLASDTGKAYTLTFDLDSKEYAEQQKEIGATIRKMRAAGDRVTGPLTDDDGAPIMEDDGKTPKIGKTPKSVAAYAGEVDKKTNQVNVTFKVIQKIRRPKADDNTADSTENSEADAA